MFKLLLYNGQPIQSLFDEFAYDRYFFTNLNRELNYHIVQCINASKKYELFYGCTKITDITKLTIQFLQLLGEGFNITFHDNIIRGIVKVKKGNKIINNNVVKKDEENKENESIGSDDSESNSINFEINEEIVEKAINLTIKNELNKRRVIPLVQTKSTIYESMINNLKIIYNLMRLNVIIEGELAFDKLCILSSNLIDFIIEFIDTKKDLTYIIDNNIKNLFFGKRKNIYLSKDNVNDKGVSSIFTLRINENDEDNLDKYKLRKTMIAYIKIKYYQLLRVYLQIGKKEEFTRLMLSNDLGPFQLFQEILYYMKELINNLVSKNFAKYKKLLEVKNEKSYIKTLTNFYIFDSEFNSSIEISVIFQICLILITLEDTYKINTLKDYFIKLKLDQNNKEENIDFNKEKEEIEEKEGEEKKEDVVGFSSVASPSSPRTEDNYYHVEHYKTESLLIDELDMEEKFVKGRLNYAKNKPIYQQIGDTPYSHLEDNYKKVKKRKDEEIKEKLLNEKKKKKTKLDKEYLKLDSEFVKAIYYFFSSLISKVEIRMISSDENLIEKIKKKKNNEKENIFNNIAEKVAKELLKLQRTSKRLSRIAGVNPLDQKNNLFLEVKNSDEEIEDIGNKTAFFLKPYLSFHLTESTKNYFINNVDRTNMSTKFSSLISFADYCLFEMMYNKKFIDNSKITKRLSKIDFYYIQIINFVLILIGNGLLMYHYYRPPSLSLEEYDVIDPDLLNTRFIDVLIVVFVKLGLFAITFIIWLYCKFILTYQRNIIYKEGHNFVFRQLGETSQNINQPIMVDFFQKEGSLMKTMDLINKNLSILNKIKIALFDSIIANLEINIFVFSLILDLLFIFFGSPLYLSIETMFIVGIFPSLLNIFRAFTTSISSLISTLFFIYCIIYIYNWLVIYYFREAYDFGEVFEYDSGKYVNERFCDSSLQCFLTMINYGTRAGVGIGDDLPVTTFKNEPNLFIARFFYDMSYYILVTMIMGNVTFGLIVDSFGGLRDETYAYEKDKKDVCFICQLTRNRALIKNIDFNDHVNNDHNVWNYVDFLCYLHFYDANNL